MAHHIQYHNYEKLLFLPRREPPFLEGKGCITTSVKGVGKTRGDTAFLIVGIGKPKRSFFLWERFEIESVEYQGEYTTEKGKKRESYVATGKGWQLIPPAKLKGKAFDQFKRRCADFARFRCIDDLPYLATLLALSEANRKRSYDEELDSFCTNLLDLAPDDGEAWYYRGTVRQQLGRLSDAAEDFEVAASLFKQLLNRVEKNIREEERDSDGVDRLRTSAKTSPGDAP